MTTHLICPNPEGPKYEASVKWGVPVVSKEWLLDCVKYKCRLSENQYPIDNKGTFNDFLNNFHFIKMHLFQ